MASLEYIHHPRRIALHPKSRQVSFIFGSCIQQKDIRWREPIVLFGKEEIAVECCLLGEPKQVRISGSQAYSTDKQKKIVKYTRQSIAGIDRLYHIDTQDKTRQDTNKE